MWSCLRLLLGPSSSASSLGSRLTEWNSGEPGVASAPANHSRSSPDLRLPMRVARTSAVHRQVGRDSGAVEVVRARRIEGAREWDTLVALALDDSLSHSEEIFRVAQTEEVAQTYRGNT